MSTAKALTADYDHWLAAEIRVDAAQVRRKHAELRSDAFRFLRGTYYVWLVRVLEELPEALDGERVPIVGDLHVENFGTWRDALQIRRWGVNDLDELAAGPWRLDLLRLAVSAVLTPHIALEDEEVCDRLLDGYATAEPQQAVDLAEDRAGHLRALVPAFADPERYYIKLAAGEPHDDVPAAVVQAAARVAPTGWQPTWHEHEAGTGSLGHRRRVGVGPAADGRLHAREVKELGPGAAAWAGPRDPRLPDPGGRLYPAVLRTIGGPAAAVRVHGWQVRDLAPDVVRIDLSALHRKDAARLLASMTRACVDVHATDARAAEAARAAASATPHQEFRAAVHTLAERVRADFEQYAG